ncbi:helix-turn-helix domain-containing protein [Nocardioides fonticola]|uniref:Helix-turn-helix domain-containing protein n=1 Tax=Nocardioides fonticola TaxID=450363 RepID=A0ABP7XIF3_9ACTN
MPTETSQTLDRGLRVLKELAAAPDGLTITELAARLGVNRTIVYRLVTTLEQHALVRREPGGRVQVGLGVLHIASAVNPVLRETAVPVLRELAEAVGCTAHLTVADGSQALAVAVVEPTRTDFHVSYRVGTRHPLEQGAAGKAILLGRQRGRRLPYVATVGELQAGAHGVAAPLGVAGLEASVGVVTLGDVDEEAVGAAVLDAARQLSDALG